MTGDLAQIAGVVGDVGGAVGTAASVVKVLAELFSTQQLAVYEAKKIYPFVDFVDRELPALLTRKDLPNVFKVKYRNTLVAQILELFLHSFKDLFEKDLLAIRISFKRRRLITWSIIVWLSLRHHPNSRQDTNTLSEHNLYRILQESFSSLRGQKVLEPTFFALILIFTAYRYYNKDVKEDAEKLEGISKLADFIDTVLPQISDETDKQWMGEAKENMKQVLVILGGIKEMLGERLQRLRERTFNLQVPLERVNGLLEILAQDFWETSLVIMADKRLSCREMIKRELVYDRDGRMRVMKNHPVYNKTLLRDLKAKQLEEMATLMFTPIVMWENIEILYREFTRPSQNGDVPNEFEEFLRLNVDSGKNPFLCREFFELVAQWETFLATEPPKVYATYHDDSTFVEQLSNLLEEFFYCFRVCFAMAQVIKFCYEISVQLGNSLLSCVHFQRIVKTVLPFCLARLKVSVGNLEKVHNDRQQALLNERRSTTQQVLGINFTFVNNALCHERGIRNKIDKVLDILGDIPCSGRAQAGQLLYSHTSESRFLATLIYFLLAIYHKKSIIDRRQDWLASMQQRRESEQIDADPQEQKLLPADCMQISLVLCFEITFGVKNYIDFNCNVSRDLSGKHTPDHTKFALEFQNRLLSIVSFHLCASDLARDNYSNRINSCFFEIEQAINQIDELGARRLFALNRPNHPLRSYMDKVLQFISEMRTKQFGLSQAAQRAQQQIKLLKDRLPSALPGAPAPSSARLETDESRPPPTPNAWMGASLLHSPLPPVSHDSGVGIGAASDNLAVVPLPEERDKAPRGKGNTTARKQWWSVLSELRSNRMHFFSTRAIPGVREARGGAAADGERGMSLTPSEASI